MVVDMVQSVHFKMVRYLVLGRASSLNVFASLWSAAMPLRRITLHIRLVQLGVRVRVRYVLTLALRVW
jgi:hypothetical protein